MAVRPEFVLVVERGKLFTEGFTPHGFFSNSATLSRPFEYILDNAFFMERAYAEIHPQYKQIIPYIVVNSVEGKVDILDETTYPLFVYQRTKKGGEKRLHNMFSIGIGGHINPEDNGESGLHTFVAGAIRELREELNVVLSEDSETLDDQICSPIGYINDDTTRVGAVHFGVVCSVLVQTATVRETSQIQGDFAYPHQLDAIPGRIKSKEVLGFEPGEYESWSQMLISTSDLLLSTSKLAHQKKEAYFGFSTPEESNV